MKMRATRAFTYDTRRLLPGDVFEVKRRRDGMILRAVRKAVEVEELPAPVVAPPPPEPPRGDDLAAIRAEYETVVGRRPFMGWDADTLRDKIAAHKADDPS